MKFLYLLVALFAASSLGLAQQQGAVKSRVVTQTSSGSSSGTGFATAPGTATSGTGTTGTTGTGATVTETPTAGVVTGTDTPLTAVPTQTAGSIVAGTNGTSSGQLQNTTNLFGRITGVTSNTVPTTLGFRPTGGGGATISGGGGASVGTVAQQTAAGVTRPGFTQIVITLQGTVQSETDRQAILNRFQNIPGFVVVDQMELAGATGAPVNEAAGASTGFNSVSTNQLFQP